MRIAVQKSKTRGKNWCIGPGVWLNVINLLLKYLHLPNLTAGAHLLMDNCQ